MGLKARTSPGPWVILVLGLFLAPTSGSRAQVLTEQQAKAAVHRIVQHSGLLPNFEVRENRSIPTAIAFIKNRKRYIEYNPAFMVRLMDSTRTDHAAISILAHEVAHHLLGHTLDPGQLHPGDELACDRYSGFILRSMGADLPTTLAAMAIAGDPHGTERHPPRPAGRDRTRLGKPWPDLSGRSATTGGPSVQRAVRGR